ncbi:MAG: hypothetical protein AAGE37_10305 [Pseudomonadota bacterium]
MSKSKELSVADFFRFGMEAEAHSAKLESQRQNMPESNDAGSAERNSEPGTTEFS